MKVLITGHRLHKLQAYDLPWVHQAMRAALLELQSTKGFVMGYAGMASGVDLWFCQACQELRIPYVACVPFRGQEDTMTAEDAHSRAQLIATATRVMEVRNSWMVAEAQMGIAVWDANKGGTHNVVQQLVELHKPFIWINPVSRVVWPCLV